MDTTNDSWNAKLYDNKHSFVSKYENSLIELVAPKQGEKVLDLGCGTGDLANKFYEYGSEIIGVDKSENMVQQAIRKFPHIKFLVQDATELDYQHEFDVVFSDATLHWVQPPLQALHGIYQCLKKVEDSLLNLEGKAMFKR